MTDIEHHEPRPCPDWCRADLVDPGDGVITHVSGGAALVDLDRRGQDGYADSVEITVEQVGDGPTEILLHSWPEPTPIEGGAPDIALTPAEATALAEALLAAVGIVNGRPPPGWLLRYGGLTGA